MLYRKCIRRMLFCADAEWVHRHTIRLLAYAGLFSTARACLRLAAPADSPSLRQVIDGLSFPHPIGLAAGWDKNGEAVLGAHALGFAATEIGSISARPSKGNGGKRLWRMPDQRALRVNYGLPNVGAAQVANLLEAQLAHMHGGPTVGANRQKSKHWESLLGINLVATNDTKTREASIAEFIHDYEESATVLAPYADYLTLNLSCPNTELVEDPFSDPDALHALLDCVSAAAGRPMFLKIPPSREPQRIDYWLEHCDDHPAVKGFIFNLPPGGHADPSGGATVPSPHPGAVSGPPIRELMLNCVRGAYQRMPKGRYVLVGGGGIESGDDVYQFLAAGASIVQIYTALVYQGPLVIRRMLRRLRQRMEKEGLKDIRELIGQENSRK